MEKMRRLGIKPSAVLRKALEDELRKKEVEKIKEEASSLRAVLDKIPVEEITGSVREDRDNG